MIIVNIMGGLGNQMFQYAAARHLSIINNTQLKIDASNFNKCTANKEHSFQLDSFNISAPQALKYEVTQFRPSSNKFNKIITRIRKALECPATDSANHLLYSEPQGSCFKPDFFKLGPDVYLFGYFNSYKYFEPIRAILVEEYTPKKPISFEARNVLKLIETTNSVSIHIRRGDYVTDPNVKKCIEGIITDNYYNNAIEYISSRVDCPHFFVFSNDMPWVKGNLDFPFATTFVDINSPQKGYEDLWMMSRCKHNITAGGSTFSWWAAYLNTNREKIIIRTENVSNEPEYNHPEDYFPQEWKSVAS